jgi:hypothetical protein
MLAAILPPLLPPRWSMLLGSQASTRCPVVDAWLSAPQETTEGPMPEGKRTSAEDSAGPTVVRPRRPAVEHWNLVLVDDGSTPVMAGPCEHQVEPFDGHWVDPYHLAQR